MKDKETFAERWSRLKREDPVPPPAETPEPAPEDERPDEEILEELGLPHPDELQPGDDIRGFMKAAVPDRLRRLALRSLWRSNPVLANVDGLVDYGGDFTDSALAVENLQTLYQVGKGMLRDLAEPEEAISEAPDQPLEEPPAAPEPPAVAENTVESVADAAEAPALQAEEAEEVEIAPTSRRMAFRFDD